MVTLLKWRVCVPKPELRHWKVGLVSEETAVFTPHPVILVTVAGMTWVCTSVTHPACALVAARRGHTPVRHLRTVTWRQPSVSFSKQAWCITLILDELFTVAGHSSKMPAEPDSPQCTPRHVSNNLLDHNRSPEFWFHCRDWWLSLPHLPCHSCHKTQWMELRLFRCQGRWRSFHLSKMNLDFSSPAELGNYISSGQ